MKSIIEQKLKVFLWGVLGVIIFLEITLRGLGLFYSVKSRQDKPDSQSRYSVLCVGDSFVFGCGAPFGKSFPTQLEALLNSHKAAKVYSVINRGIPTQNTTQLLENLDNYIETVRPDVIVILSGGANNWNFEGYQTYLRGKSLRAMLYNCLYRVRIFKLVKLLVMRFKEASVYKRNIPPALIDSETFSAKGKDAPIDMPQFKETRGMANKYGKDAAIGMDMDNQGLKVDVYRADAYAGLGYINSNEGNIEEAMRLYGGAERIYKKAIEDTPDDARNYMRLAYLNLYLHRTDEAKELFHRAISKSIPLNKTADKNGEALADEIDKNEKRVMDLLSGGDSYAGLGYINSIEGNEREALKWYNAAQDVYEKAISVNPGDGYAYMGLAYLNLYRGKNVEADESMLKAEELCKKAMKLSPPDDNACLLLAYIYMGKGDFEEAKNIFLAKAQTLPGGKRLAHISFGFVKNDSQRNESAGTDSVDSPNGLGNSNLMRGNLKEAFKYFKKAIETNPEGYENYAALGLISQSRGNFTEAINWYKKAIALNPRETQYYKFIALNYQNLGNFDEAAAFFKSSRKYIGAMADDFIMIFEKGDRCSEEIQKWVKDDLERMVIACQKKGVRVVLQNYPNYFLWHLSIVKQVADKYAIPLVDNFGSFKNYGIESGKFFVEDGHCNSLGYGVMAKNIYKVILREKMIGLNENIAMALRLKRLYGRKGA